MYVGKDNVTIHDGSAKFTGNGMVNMYRFANVPFKTELVMNFQFDSSEAGKCHVYWERNGEYVHVFLFTI